MIIETDVVFCIHLTTQDSDEDGNEGASSDDDYSATRRKANKRRKASNVRQICYWFPFKKYFNLT